MKALTVQQPWAWAIVDGQKNVENRNWAPKVRPSSFAIHAGKTWSWDGDRFVSRYGNPHWLDVEDDALAMGAVIGVVDLIDCHIPDDSLQGRWSPCVVHGCARWGMKGVSWHWVLSRPRRLFEPIACAGKLGLWELPADVAARLDVAA